MSKKNIICNDNIRHIEKTSNFHDLAKPFIELDVSGFTNSI